MKYTKLAHVWGAPRWFMIIRNDYGKFMMLVRVTLSFFMVPSCSKGGWELGYSLPFLRPRGENLHGCNHTEIRGNHGNIWGFVKFVKGWSVSLSQFAWRLSVLAPTWRAQFFFFCENGLSTSTWPWERRMSPQNFQTCPP